MTGREGTRRFLLWMHAPEYPGWHMPGEGRERLRDALGAEWEPASDLLTDSFAEQSICAQSEPAYELESSRTGSRFAACHLHRE